MSAPAQSVRIAVSGINGDSPFTNVLWIVTSTVGPDGGEMNNFANAFLAAFASSFAGLLNDACVLDSAVADYAVGDGTFIRGTGSASISGTRSGDELPGQVACCISWKTAADSYRGGHGRTYLPAGVTSDLGSARFWSADFTDSVNSQATDFRSTEVPGLTDLADCQLVIMRRVSAGVPLVPFVPHPVTGNAVDRRFDTQRRRLGPDI